MYPVSQAFEDTVASSHRVAVTCDLLYDGSVVAEDVSLVGGSISENRTRIVRRDGNLTLHPAYAPTLSTWLDDVLPKGVEARPKRGVVLPDGSIEYAGLGVLMLVDVALERATGAVKVRLQDRAARLTEDDLEPGYDASGDTTKATVEALLARTYPDLTITWDVTLANPTLPGGTVFTGTAAAAIDTLIQGIGGEFRFDGDGDPEVVPLPTLSNASPVTTWREGVDGVVIDRTDTVTRAGAFNAVRVTGQAVGDTATPYGWAEISSGDMQYGGPFGRLVKKVSAPNLLTNADCQDLADALIGDGVGLPHSIDLAVLPNPAIQASDGVTIERTDGLSVTHLLEQVTVDLSASAAIKAQSMASPWTP